MCIFPSDPLIVLTASRPFPDERPRQSVANLIGRFDQQRRRQPNSSGPPSRATSDPPIVFTASRPLPDQRTRQSVANLIGRYEQQQTRQPNSSGPPWHASASSTTSNNTGDANGTRSSSSPPAAPLATVRGTTTITTITTLVHPVSDDGAPPERVSTSPAPTSDLDSVAAPDVVASTVDGEEPIIHHHA